MLTAFLLGLLAAVVTIAVIAVLVMGENGSKNMLLKSSRTAKNTKSHLPIRVRLSMSTSRKKLMPQMKSLWMILRKCVL